MDRSIHVQHSRQLVPALGLWAPHTCDGLHPQIGTAFCGDMSRQNDKHLLRRALNRLYTESDVISPPSFRPYLATEYWAEHCDRNRPPSGSSGAGSSMKTFARYHARLHTKNSKVPVHRISCTTWPAILCLLYATVAVPMHDSTTVHPDPAGCIQAYELAPMSLREQKSTFCAAVRTTKPISGVSKEKRAVVVCI